MESCGCPYTRGDNVKGHSAGKDCGKPGVRRIPGKTTSKKSTPNPNVSK